MEPLTIRVQADTKESLAEEAAEYDVSVSEYVRQLLEKGREYDDLAERLEARESRIDELESQLSRRSQIEEKIEALPDKVREADTYQERRRRLLDRATVAQRLKWKITGVPVDELDENN
jgi:chromosome segregation ATPase